MPIALALVCAALAIYAAIWILIAALWIVVGSFVASGLAGIALLAWFTLAGHPATGLFQCGVGLVLSGIGLVSIFGVVAASSCLAKLTQRFARWVKSLFVKKDESHE